MVAAIMLQKKRLVDILEEACDLDPLSGVVVAAGEDRHDLSSSAKNSIVLPPGKRRRNSLILAARVVEGAGPTAAAAASSASSSCPARGDPLMLLAESSSFHSESSSSTRATRSPTVRFCQAPPQVRYFSNYLPSMNEEEREKVRTSIWYTRDEFESFMMDRVHTIRVWRSVGGDITNNGLGEHYCLRGLEPYQSPAHNAEMHSHRYLYTMSILNEQDRLRALCGPDNYDSFAVAGQVSHMSHRAAQQARLLALQDETDAREVETSTTGRHGGKRRSLHNPGENGGSARRRKSSMSRRHTMNHTSTCVGSSISSTSHSDPSRIKLAPSLSSSALSPPTAARNKVDVNLLKEMNAKFLQSLMASRQSSSSTSLPATNETSGKVASQEGDHMTLSSLMWNSGQLSRLQLPPSHLGGQPSTMTSMQRRHSLDFDNVERNEAIMSQPFLAIRRDSLHCLMSSSSSAAARHAQTQPS